jgi:hypothetical protein
MSDEGEDMVALPIREKITAELDTLSDEQAIVVLQFIQSVKADEITDRVLTEGDDEDDALVGFFSAGPDFAESSEEILHQEFGLRQARDFKDE